MLELLLSVWLLGRMLELGLRLWRLMRLDLLLRLLIGLFKRSRFGLCIDLGRFLWLHSWIGSLSIGLTSLSLRLGRSCRESGLDQFFSKYL